MSNLSIFNFNNSQVRVHLLDDQPIFCLTDITEILNIKNANASRFNLSTDGIHKMYSVDSLNRKNEITFINEPNLYRVIFRSNKREALNFQNWVFEEVLPTIRKTGSYSLTINPQQQQIIKQAVKGRAYRTTEHYLVIYAKLYEQFKIPRYQELPASQFDNAIEFLGGVSSKPDILTGDELCDLAWVVKAAEHMRAEFEEIEPALRTLKSERATRIYTMSREYHHTINRCKQIVQQKMKTTKIDRTDLNWQRILPFIQ